MGACAEFEGFCVCVFYANLPVYSFVCEFVFCFQNEGIWKAVKCFVALCKLEGGAVFALCCTLPFKVAGKAVVAAVFALFAFYHKVAAKASCYKRKEYWRVISPHTFISLPDYIFFIALAHKVLQLCAFCVYFCCKVCIFEFYKHCFVLLLLLIIAGMR